MRLQRVVGGCETMALADFILQAFARNLAEKYGLDGMPRYRQGFVRDL
ncbi:MAG: hypothetical protein ACLTXL_07015 [Clostridia bacterium]